MNEDISIAIFREEKAISETNGREKKIPLRKFP
jgi:hypothetical protein